MKRTVVHSGDDNSITATFKSSLNDMYRGSDLAGLSGDREFSALEWHFAALWRGPG